MKKILLILFLFPFILSACSSDNDGDKFSQRQVTQSELESGSATYYSITGYTTDYLVFNNGTLRTTQYKDGKFMRGTYYKKYEIKGDSIYLTLKDVLDGKTKEYTMYIQMIHWGYDKKSGSNLGGDQVLIRGDKEEIPYRFQIGYYDKSVLSLN